MFYILTFFSSKVKKQQELNTVQTFPAQTVIDVLSQQEHSWKMSQRPSPLCSLPHVSIHYWLVIFIKMKPEANSRIRRGPLKKKAKEADFLLRAAATLMLRPSPHTPGVTVTVSPSKRAVRGITTALENIKSSADPISWGEILRRIFLVWSSDVCVLTSQLIDTEISARAWGGGGLTSSSTVVVDGVIFPSSLVECVFFKSQAKSSAFELLVLWC